MENFSQDKNCWGPNSLRPPADSGGEADGARQVFDLPVEAVCDAAPGFEPAEHALDDVALSVDCAVVIVLNLAAFARWNDGLRASPDQRTMLAIALRANLAELGLVANPGIAHAMKLAEQALADKKSLSSYACTALEMLDRLITAISNEIVVLDQQIAAWHAQSEASRRLVRPRPRRNHGDGPCYHRH
jgi:hypothetical protein